MLLVPIVAAHGMLIPKTSSRAITSPAGTADTMELLAQVELSPKRLHEIVRRERGCLAWGGTARLAPVDDILISVERPLSMDSPGQMIASILSKKVAAGSTHLLLDIPVGPTAKVRRMQDAVALRKLFEFVGDRMGLHTEVIITDGSQPIGRGIGPFFELRDVMQVLENDPQAPQDLRQKALRLAGRVLEFDLDIRGGQDYAVARDILDSGRALEKMQAIVRAQGASDLAPAPGRLCRKVHAPRAGYVTAIDNLRMANLARLAGAPMDKGAGVDLNKKLGGPGEEGRAAVQHPCGLSLRLPVCHRDGGKGYRLRHRQRAATSIQRTGALSMILGFGEYEQQARALAAEAGRAYDDVLVHRFPDGESMLRLPDALPPRVVLCRSLDHPNDKLIELVLAAAEARVLGAQHLTLVAPYLCYMRQDRSFHSGEAVSQRIIGNLLAEHFDALVTVDPHLHRVHSMEQTVPTGHSLALLATDPVGDVIGQRVPGALLVGPDGESEQWVARAATRAGSDYVVGTKVRHGDRDVDIDLQGDFEGRDVVLVDDVASTGRTLEVAARIIQAQGPASISVVVTHALFAGDALQRLEAVGIRNVWSTDSIPHPSNAIPLAPLLAGALVV